MCFGSKDNGDDTPAPRPAQQSPPAQSGANGGRVSDSKKTQQHGQSASRPHSGSGSASGAGGAGQSYAPPPGPPPGHYAPPSGPPPGRRDEYAPPSGPPPGRQDYGPPSGPPPGHRDEYAPPSGPPPGQHHNEYAPPPGPPPGRHDEYAPPSGPPPGHSNFSHPPGPPPSHRDEYAPPSGPPPGHGNFSPPPGPPPGQHKGQWDDAPPSGPPPSHQDWIAPPPGPPPGAKDKAPEHAWQDAVPDTSLFPPPPAIFSGHYMSPTSNADKEEANAGEEWCERYPLTQPMVLDQAGRTALQYHNIRLMEPSGFNGKLNWVSPGRWEGQTTNKSRDQCIIGYPPLYLVNDHDPTRTGQPKAIYYEVKLRSDSPNVFLGLGFTALPYPSFRMPGWHRGSLAVHGDDGHKYINDRWGGRDFTESFRRGDTYGIGMRFQPTGGPRPQVDIFFTRNGKQVGSWNLHEETDAQEDLPVTGLEGFHDLSCAIGTYEGVSFDVIFNPAQWMYRDL
jgi:hypothetical protein